MSDTPKTDAMCQDDFLVNHYADPPEIYVPAEFARGMERQLSESQSAFASQRKNYTELYEAVIGEGAVTADFKDAVAIARERREENERMKRELVTLKLRCAGLTEVNSEPERAACEQHNQRMERMKEALLPGRATGAGDICSCER